MANCPKCGYHLKFTDIKAECPKCGVNLMYYNTQERLARDADMAEEEHIRFQPRLDRVKFAFIGTPFTIVRIVLLFLPIGMLFLPLVHVAANLPYRTVNSDLSILSFIQNVLTKMDFGVLLSILKESAVFRVAAIFFLLAVLFLFAAAVVSILNIAFVAVSCSPKGFGRNMRLSGCGIAFMILSMVSFFVFSHQVTAKLGSEAFTGSVSIGAFLVILAFILLMIVNVIIKKQNKPVKYSDLTDYIVRIKKRKAEIDALEEEMAKEKSEAAAEPVAVSAE